MSVFGLNTTLCQVKEPNGSSAIWRTSSTVIAALSSRETTDVDVGAIGGISFDQLFGVSDFVIRQIS